MSKPLPAGELETWLRDSRWGQNAYEPNKTARVSLLVPRSGNS
jgi:hypothetical protein